VWVLRLDAVGNVLWQKALDSSHSEQGSSVDISVDGGFIVGGEIQFADPMDWHCIAAKLDRDGNPEWIQVFGCSSSGDVEVEVLSCEDGGFFLAGLTRGFGAERQSLWIIKLDNAGTIQWQRMYSCGGCSTVAIKKTQDRGFIIAGETDIREGRGGDFFLIKIDDHGDVQWSRAYDGGSGDEARDVIQTEDCGYAVSGYAHSSGREESAALVIKTDKNGHFESMTSFGSNVYTSADVIVQRPGGGYAIGGTDTLDFDERDYHNLIVLTDESLTIESQTNYGPGSIRSMQLTSDWGLVAAAISSIHEDMLPDTLIIKLDPDGYVGTGCPEGFGQEAHMEIFRFPIYESELPIEVSDTDAYLVDVDFTVRDTDAQEVSICAP
jgi:hypothetical protein